MRTRAELEAEIRTLRFVARKATAALQAEIERTRLAWNNLDQTYLEMEAALCPPKAKRIAQFKEEQARRKRPAKPPNNQPKRTDSQRATAKARHAGGSRSAASRK